MFITSTKRRPAPDGAPVVHDPVSVTMDVQVLYPGSGMPERTLSPIYCSRSFAAIVLMTMNAWAEKYGFAIVHLGVYNPRKARKADGTPILPSRWSNHAYGEAMDWAGIVTTDGKWLKPRALRSGSPAKYRELLDSLRAVIASNHRREEIVDEGGWIHIGMFPEG